MQTKLLDLNGFLTDSITENPKKVSRIVKYIFEHEGCTVEELSNGTNLSEDIISRRLNDLRFDNQVIREKDKGYYIRFPHHPFNEKPQSRLDKMRGDLHNLQMSIIQSEYAIPNNVIAMDLQDIINKYK